MARTLSRIAGSAIATLALLAGCGGGGGGGGGGGPPPALNIATVTVADGVIGSLYVHTVFVTGGSGAKNFRVSAGSLPAGLALDAASGEIRGTPSGPAGITSLSVTVTDSGSPQQTDTQAFNFRIATLLAIDIGSPPLATIGVAYSHAVAASGGTPPYTFSSGLPPGLSIASDGLISGTPSSDARSLPNTRVLVRDSAVPQQEISDSLKFTVRLEVATTAMPDAVGGMEYREFLIAQGGHSGVRWIVTGGSLPLGFPINGSILNGEVRFRPVAFCSPTTSTFDVEATDSDTPPQVATGQDISMTVVKGTLALAPASLAAGRVGVAYSAFIRPTLGVLPYNFSVSAGALPAGLTIHPTSGQITGTPTAVGIHNFTILVTDDCGTAASQSFNLVVGTAPLGRNDSIATATVLGNGRFFASISPSGHPNTVFDPDEDYYSITTFAASTVTIDLEAQGGEIDTVIEIVDAGGARLGNCGPPAFTSTCVNDDEVPGFELDSFLQLRVSGPATFFVRVVEWRGDARPDLTYTIDISGVN